jgi:putative ABC transport system substrate-binding protein
MNLAADDAEGQARIATFLQGLQKLGWTDGGNVRIDYRWAAGDTGRFQRYAEELRALAPDVILASASPSVQALQRATRTVPIVFVQVTDPVGAGFVQSLARPGAVFGVLLAIVRLLSIFGPTNLRRRKDSALRLHRSGLRFAPMENERDAALERPPDALLLLRQPNVRCERSR